ncbi:hypothetical protein RI129_001270 [Pyrocoelia pectoralis]|uniref:GIY-YIG domain-containing protein n=1 Tax=Pyrocoelia pectoralis TaxID=417401 RepID=A0AAN7ZX39_9COLE
MEEFIRLIKQLELSRILHQLKNTLQKRHKNDAHINFLTSAKQHDVIPKFLQIKLPKNKYNYQEAHNIHMTLLKKELKKQHINRTFIHSKLKYLHRYLLQQLHYIEYETLINDLEEDIRTTNIEMDQKRQKKLQHLIKQYHQPPTTQTNTRNHPSTYRRSTNTTQWNHRKHQTNQLRHNAQEEITEGNTHLDCPTQNNLNNHERKEDKYKFHNRFTNLSNTFLNKNETDLLNLGHKFSPAPNNYNPHLITIDIEHQLLPHQRCQSIKEKIKDTIINKVSKPSALYSTQISSHTRHQQHTIKSLKQKIKEQELTFTYADKNAGLVILDNNTYIQKTEQFYKDNNITEVKHNPLNRFAKYTNNTLKHCEPTLQKLNTSAFKLKVRNPTLPASYSLIKLHKANNPIRPITSSINSPVHKIAKFLNQLIKNKFRYISKHSINNSLHLINTLDEFQRHHNKTLGYTLHSFDIVNLYTNIPTHDTIKILTDYLYNNEHFINTFRINPLDIENIIDLSLLANFFIDHLETKIALIPEFTHVALWKRYVDDILCIWTGTPQELTQFHDKINTISNIKFTLETENNNSINFLDLTITRNTNNIEYDIYRKPTTTDVIIPFHSFHAPQIKSAAFNFLFNRLLTIPLSSVKYEKELNLIFQIGKNNNYPTDYIQHIYHKTKKKSILKQVYPHHKTHCNYIAIQYHPQIYNKINNTLKTHNINTIARAHPTIASHLINNKIPQPIHKKAGIYEIKCNECNVSYIGLTTRNLQTRFQEHLKNKPKSAIGTHTVDTQHHITLNNMKLLHASDNYNKLTILEHYEIEKAVRDKKDIINEITTFNEHHIYKLLPPFNIKAHSAHPNHPTAMTHTHASDPHTRQTT